MDQQQEQRRDKLIEQATVSLTVWGSINHHSYVISPVINIV